VEFVKKLGYFMESYEKIACLGLPCMKIPHKIVPMLCKVIVVFETKPNKSIYCDWLSPSKTFCAERSGIGTPHFVKDGILDKGDCKGLDYSTFDRFKPSIIYATEIELYYLIGNETISKKSYKVIFDCSVSSIVGMMTVAVSIVVVFVIVIVSVYLIMETYKNRHDIKDEVPSGTEADKSVPKSKLSNSKCSYSK